MIYCYLLLQSLNYGHYFVLVKTNYADMCIIANKSQCIRLGRRLTALQFITASDGAINLVDCCRYFVFFTSGCTFKCNFDSAKSCFFRAFNALYSKVGRLASEEVVLSLIRANSYQYCYMRLRRVHYSRVTEVLLNLL